METEASTIAPAHKETETPQPPILTLAWARYATLSNHSGRRNAGFLNMRRWIAYLGVLATLFAILNEVLKDQIAYYDVVAWIAKIIFIATPILASTLAAFASKKYANGDWWVTRGAAEEIKKNIYFYRTIWPEKERRKKLEDAMADIQRQVYRAMGGVFSFDNYNGPLPQSYNPKDPKSDPGFKDLNGEDYFTYRLEDQLNWHNGRINRYKKERDRLTILIFLTGALGTVLATLGEGWGIWVALTASITTALIGWEQLRNIETIMRNYSKVVLELSILKDHWVNLDHEHLTAAEYDKEFKKLVNDTEQVLGAQNTEYIKSMQDVLKESSLDKEAELVNNTIEEGFVVTQRTKDGIQQTASQVLTTTLNETGKVVEQTFQTTLESVTGEASELAQRQLEAVSQVVTEAAQDLAEQVPTLPSSLAQVNQEFSNVEVGRDTSKEELNRILASYPKTGEVKG